jgi:Skp family chaperone for outer membrane proteins
MRKKLKGLVGFATIAAITFCLTYTPPSLIAAPTFARTQGTQPAPSTASSPLVSAFEKKVKEYANLRESLENKLPKLSKEATPEEIEAHKKSFQEIVRAARTTAKRGDVLSPRAAIHIRATIKNEFKGKERAELRKTVMEAETRGVPLRVNSTYPASKELVEMPPTLLLKLPQLPKQVRYRFVGHNLLLVDRENGLIVDYMTNALP